MISGLVYIDAEDTANVFRMNGDTLMATPIGNDGTFSTNPEDWVIAELEGSLPRYVREALAQEGLLKAMQSAAFVLETVAHLRGKERGLLPVADVLRRRVDSMKD